LGDDEPVTEPTDEQQTDHQTGEPVGPTLDEWTVRLATALDLPAELAGLDVRQVVLDLARDAARGVARPAAPLTTFLAGVALASASGTAGTSSAEAVEAVATRIRAELPGD